MLKLTAIIIVILAQPFTRWAEQEHKERIQETYSFDSSAKQKILIVKNIQGSVFVEGYQDAQISVDLEKRISAETPEDLEEGKQDISLGVINTGDSIILFTDSPYATLKRKNGKVSYQWDCGLNEMSYKFNFDYVIRIPYGTLVDVSTVNDGDVKVSDTKASVQACNVNGSVILENIPAVTLASTVNGDVECEILENPVENCTFHTINGDMKISYPSGLSADVSYEAMHGDFYTNFDVKILPASVEKTEESTRESTIYKIEKNPKFRIGKGDVEMRFKTINGNMILKKTN